MRHSIRRSLATLLLLALCAQAGAPSAPPPQQQPALESSPAAFLYEVRLRKLHLVRPDLIPYPVAYEVYC